MSEVNRPSNQRDLLRVLLEDAELVSYEHGGARLMVRGERGVAERELIADFYGNGEWREFFMQLVQAESKRRDAHEPSADAQHVCIDQKYHCGWKDDCIACQRASVPPSEWLRTLRAKIEESASLQDACIEDFVSVFMMIDEAIDRQSLTKSVGDV